MDVKLSPAVLLLVHRHLVAHERLPAFTHSRGNDLVLQVQEVEDDEEAIVRDVVHAAAGSQLTERLADAQARGTGCLRISWKRGRDI